MSNTAAATCDHFILYHRINSQRPTFTRSRGWVESRGRTKTNQYQHGVKQPLPKDMLKLWLLRQLGVHMSGQNCLHGNTCELAFAGNLASCPMSLSNEPQTTILLTIPHMLLRLCFQLRVSASKLALSKGFMDSCPLATSLNCEPCTSELMILVLAEYYPPAFLCSLSQAYT